MPKKHAKSPMVILKDATSYFLAGGLLISASTNTTFNPTDLVLRRLNYVTLATGIFLAFFGTLYSSTILQISFFKSLSDRLDKWSVWLYPLIFSVASAQVINLAFDSSVILPLRIAAIFFLVLLLAFIAYDSKIVFQQASSLLYLIVIFNILAFILIFVSVENWLDLLEPRNIQPLFLLSISIVFAFLLYSLINKKDKPK